MPLATGSEHGCKGLVAFTSPPPQYVPYSTCFIHITCQLPISTVTQLLPYHVTPCSVGDVELSPRTCLRIQILEP
jgi:hypothetical protein